MIQQITTPEDRFVGFRALGEVTQDDYNTVVIPSVNLFVSTNGFLNFMFVLDTSVKNFTLGAWWKDSLIGIKNISKWRRAAIVSDSEMIIKFTDLFSYVVPGEFKGFRHDELQQAIKWTAKG